MLGSHQGAKSLPDHWCPTRLHQRGQAPGLVRLRRDAIPSVGQRILRLLWLREGGSNEGGVVEQRKGPAYSCAPQQTRDRERAGIDEGIDFVLEGDFRLRSREGPGIEYVPSERPRAAVSTPQHTGR